MQEGFYGVMTKGAAVGLEEKECMKKDVRDMFS